ncbi:flagellar hook-associated protein FlgL [Aquabacterium sp.]|uniref:flagellar hook-associated protein FlgL n=1 Tax=Aquabacterium sp. TaxID=1872578 RepID=UPI001983583E|nr:flagellar hook-associated protein FlgL [Aquabacterium sp.]MBC7701316.1 flagellar hook-associated protein FlgL [Aquabacterium sp.]
MRISTAHSFDSSIDNLQKRQSEMSQSQMQLTSGKRVNLASDDPIGAARAERALASISRDDANQRSLDASRNVMQLSESAIGDAVSLLQTARESMVAAGNGSYTDKEREALAIKLKNIRDQILSIANRSDGSGGFVFGGQGSATPPFLDTTSGVQFVGQGGQVQAAAGETLTLTVDGDQTWLKSKTGNGVYETNPASTNTGAGWITAGVVTSPSALPYPAAPGSTPPQYAVAFTVTAGVTTYSVTKDGGGTTLTDVPYASGKAIVIDGMSFAVTGQPANADNFTVDQSTNDLSVFDAMDSAIKSLTTNNQGSGQVMQAVNRGLSNLDSILGNVGAARSAVGESLNRMDSIEGRISASKLAAETERSNAEDLDMVTAISKFQNQQTGYDAALKSYAMVQKLSLFQYING